MHKTRGCSQGPPAIQERSEFSRFGNLGAEADQRPEDIRQQSMLYRVGMLRVKVD